MKSILQSIKIFSKRKLIFVCLIFLLLVVASGYLIFHKYTADEVFNIQISGIIYDSNNNTPLENASVTLTASQKTYQASPITLNTNKNGAFSVMADSNQYDNILIQKDGYIDISGSMNLKPLKSAPKASMILPLDRGTGLQNAHFQSIVPGNNLVSFPLTLADSNPENVFNYYSYNQSSNGNVNLAIVKNPFSKTKISIDANKLRFLDNQTQKSLYYDLKSSSNPIKKIESGRGYWLNYKGKDTVVIMVKGTLPTSANSSINIPKAGFIEVGFPYSSKEEWKNLVIVRNKNTDQAETKTFSEAIRDKWIKSQINFFYPDTQRSMSKGYPVNYFDNSSDLYTPGSAYQLCTTVDNLTIDFQTRENLANNPFNVSIPTDISSDDTKWLKDHNNSRANPQEEEKWQNLIIKVFNKAGAEIKNGLDSSSKVLGVNLDSNEPANIVLNLNQNSKVLESADPDLSQIDISASGSTAESASPQSDNVCRQMTSEIGICFNSNTSKGDSNFRFIKIPANIQKLVLTTMESSLPKIREIYGQSSNLDNNYTFYAVSGNNLPADLKTVYVPYLHAIIVNAKYFLLNQTAIFSQNEIDNPTFESLGKITSLSDPIKESIIEQLAHAWRGNDMLLLPGWEEGQARLVAKLSMGSEDSSTSIDSIKEYYSEINKNQLLTVTPFSGTEWYKKNNQYAGALANYSAAAWAVAYDEDSDIFITFNMRLLENRDKIKALRSSGNSRAYYNFINYLMSNSIPDETKPDEESAYTSRTVQGTPFSDWANRQYAFGTSGSPKLTLNATSYYNGLYPLSISENKNEKFTPFNYYVRENVSTELTKGSVLKPDKNSIITDSPIFDQKAGNNYTILYRCKLINKTDYPTATAEELALNKKICQKFPILASYGASHSPDSGIYGVISRKEDGARLLIQKEGISKTYDLPISSNGTFDTKNMTDNIGAEDMGKYTLVYTSNCSPKPQAFQITKGYGAYFGSIVLNNPSANKQIAESKTSSFFAKAKNKIAGLFGIKTNKAFAANQCPVAANLEIKNTKKEVKGTGIEVTFESSKPVYSIADFGVNANEYNKETNWSAIGDNKISFGELELNKQYHFNLLSVDGSNEPAYKPNGLGENTSALQSVQSGDQAFTYYSLSDINADTKADCNGASATISWKTSVDTSGSAEIDGKASTATKDGNLYKVSLSGLKYDTTYTYKIKTSAKDATINNSESKTFRTPIKPTNCSGNGGSGGTGGNNSGGTGTSGDTGGDNGSDGGNSGDQNQSMISDVVVHIVYYGNFYGIIKANVSWKYNGTSYSEQSGNVSGLGSLEYRDRTYGYSLKNNTNYTFTIKTQDSAGKLPLAITTFNFFLKIRESYDGYNMNINFNPYSVTCSFKNAPSGPCNFNF